VTTATSYLLARSEGTAPTGRAMLCTSVSGHESGTGARTGATIDASDLDAYLADTFADPEVQFVAVWDASTWGEDFTAHYKRGPAETAEQRQYRELAEAVVREGQGLLDGQWKSRYRAVNRLRGLVEDLAELTPDDRS
jgi:hypothetical protein